jgi:histone deacetylase 6
MEEHASPQGHPERPQRIATVLSRFQKSGLADRSKLLEPREAADEELLRAHTQEHLDSVSCWFVPGGESIQVRGDNFCSEGTHRAARLAAGCVTEAALCVLSGEAEASFAVVRPPGHHAECARAGGFCFFNNASVAALACLEKENCERVAIVDWVR